MKKLALLLLTILSITLPAKGAVILYEFTGTYSFHSGSFGPSIESSVLTGYFSYDTSTTPTPGPSFPAEQTTYYSSSFTPSVFVFFIDGASPAGPVDLSAAFTVQNNATNPGPGNDGLGLIANWNAGHSANLIFSTTRNDLRNDMDLPLDIELTDYDDYVILAWYPNEGGILQYNITSISQVPEPSTLFLLILAFTLLNYRQGIRTRS